MPSTNSAGLGTLLPCQITHAHIVKRKVEHFDNVLPCTRTCMGTAVIAKDCDSLLMLGTGRAE